MRREKELQQRKHSEGVFAVVVANILPFLMVRVCSKLRTHFFLLINSSSESMLLFPQYTLVIHHASVIIPDAE